MTGRKIKLPFGETDNSQTEIVARVRRIDYCASGFLLLCVCVTLLAPGCASSGGCKDRLLGDKTSPKNLYTAALFTRQCVGTQNLLTHVNLHDGWGAPRPDLTGVVQLGEVFAIEGQQKINLVWRDEKSLLIECAGCGANKVSKKESSWKDVRISYAEGP